MLALLLYLAICGLVTWWLIKWVARPEGGALTKVANRTAEHLSSFARASALVIAKVVAVAAALVTLYLFAWPTISITPHPKTPIDDPITETFFQIEKKGFLPINDVTTQCLEHRVVAGTVRIRAGRTRPSPLGRRLSQGKPLPLFCTSMSLGPPVDAADLEIVLRYKIWRLPWEQETRGRFVIGTLFNSPHEWAQIPPWAPNQETFEIVSARMLPRVELANLLEVCLDGNLPNGIDVFRFEFRVETSVGSLEADVGLRHGPPWQVGSCYRVDVTDSQFGTADRYEGWMILDKGMKPGMIHSLDLKLVSRTYDVRREHGSRSFQNM